MCLMICAAVALRGCQCAAAGSRCAPAIPSGAWIGVHAYVLAHGPWGCGSVVWRSSFRGRFCRPGCTGWLFSWCAADETVVSAGKPCLRRSCRVLYGAHRVEVSCNANHCTGLLLWLWLRAVWFCVWLWLRAVLLVRLATTRCGSAVGDTVLLTHPQSASCRAMPNRAALPRELHNLMLTWDGLQAVGRLLSGLAKSSLKVVTAAARCTSSSLLNRHTAITSTPLQHHFHFNNTVALPA